MNSHLGTSGYTGLIQEALTYMNSTLGMHLHICEEKGRVLSLFPTLVNLRHLCLYFSTFYYKIITHYSCILAGRNPNSVVNV